jgi:acyl carrier protein
VMVVGGWWLATIRGLRRVIQRLPHSCAHVS